MSEIRFPNESAEYRAARDALTRAETELTRHVEDVAALRRALPLGGALTEDYAFTAGPADLAHNEPVTAVRLSQLFGPHDTLLLYSFMYEPGLERPQTGQRPRWGDRHVDLLWPLWNLLDLTPAGRGDNWYPAYSAKGSVTGR